MVTSGNSPGATPGNDLGPGYKPNRFRGVYALTPDEDDTSRLVSRVDACLAAGVRLLQYRNKTATPALRARQLDALQPICERYGCLLVVNDDWPLAKAMGIDAVHVGADDGDPGRVRDAMGPDALIGVSCYSSLARARTVAPLADYLAFGSVFRSPTKPLAPAASLDVLGEARALGKPVVAIGGIDAGNVGEVIRAGADAVAVIGAIFDAADPGGAARELIRRVGLVGAGGSVGSVGLDRSVRSAPRG